MSIKSGSNLLTRAEAAKYLGLNPRTLDVWACTKRYNLKFIKVGRLAKYRIEDLEQFLNERTVSNELLGNS